MSAQPRARLFCLPYAGGTAHVFRAWRGLVPDAIDVCALQLPGRGGRIREPLRTDLPDVVGDLLPQVIAGQDVPVVLFGHSLGALVAFELARALHRIGRPPAHLAVAAFRAPHLPARAEPVHHLPDQLFWLRVRSLNGTPAEVLADADMMQVVTPIVRADLQITETYRYTDQPPLPCPITAFGGLADQEIKLTELTAWRAHTTGHFRCQVFSGDHFFLHSATEALVGDLVRDLAPLLHSPDLPAEQRP